jgi:hypothetical protein
MIDSGPAPIDSALPPGPESPHSPDQDQPGASPPHQPGSGQAVTEEDSLPNRTRLRVLHGPVGGEPGAPDAEALRRLELELSAARDEVQALHQMLEDLPEIFERKFRQRLQTVLDHQQHLLADNQALRERLYALAGAAGSSTAGGGKPALPPALSPGMEAPAPLPARTLRIRRAIRRVLGLRTTG